MGLKEELQSELAQGLTRLDIALDESVQGKLIDYLLLLHKWNKAYNLTAIRDPQQMLIRHLLDSLAVLPHVRPGRIIDVGSGGGLPGIPLAICLPQASLTLLDSNGKKTRFLTQVKGELGLENVEVVHGRVEEFKPQQHFDTVITRAYASIAGILNSSRHLLAPASGEFLAMKGLIPQEELDELGDELELKELITLKVPGLEDEQRHLLRLVLTT